MFGSTWGWRLKPMITAAKAKIWLTEPFNCNWSVEGLHCHTHRATPATTTNGRRINPRHLARHLAIAPQLRATVGRADGWSPVELDFVVHGAGYSR